MPDHRAPRRSALVQLTLARLRLFFREPSTVFWSFAFPLLLTIALGIAFRSRPPEPVVVAVEAGPAAERVRAALAAGEDVQVRVLAAGEARDALRVGRVSIVVVPGDPPTYRYDPTRPESRLARAVADDLLQRAAGRADVIGPRDERVSEPGSRYVDFLIPGLVGMNVMSTGMWGIGYTIVEMRQKKLLKRLVATPMRRGDFLLSFVLVRMLFLLVEVPLLFVFGAIVFDLPVRGSIAALAAVSGLGALAFAGIGLLVAARAQNTQTVGGLINLVMLPMFVLSGVFFSSANFPDRLQPFIRALPLTALNDALRAVTNEGAGLAGVAPQALLLAALGAGTFALALRIFRWS
jgi:ABC-type multidrug transport system permease subunit